MITAVDTNVLLDVLLPSDEHVPRSRDWLSSAYNAGAIVVCDIVYAELASSFGDRVALDGCPQRDWGHPVADRLLGRLRGWAVVEALPRRWRPLGPDNCRIPYRRPCHGGG